MAVKIAFGIMSAHQQAGTVDQLIGTLGAHPVIIHHDFGQTPDFAIRRPNVQFVPAPKKTGWGNWGFSQAILHTLEHCIRNVDFDYFQLLSPTCLPIRPIEAFERRLGSTQDDANIDLIDLAADEPALMDYGYRTYAPEGSMRYRLLRRMRLWYLGINPTRTHQHSLSVVKPALWASVQPRLRSRIGLELTRLARDGWIGRHPFGRDFKAFVGSTWFGANRAVCEHIVFRAAEPGLRDYFSRAHLPDELMFPTLIGNSGFRLGGSNHLVNRFNEQGHPVWLQQRDLDRLLTATAFFARKFPDDPAAAVRLELIGRVSQRFGAGATVQGR